MTRPVPWNVAHRPTAWVDVATARGIDDAGRVVRPVIGGRRTRPSLVDLLDTARLAGVERVFLVGERQRGAGDKLRTWLLAATPGWSPGAHYLDADVPVGRFTHAETGATVQLRRAAEWFGEGGYTTAEARSAWQLLAHVQRQVFGDRAGLHDSPGSTGMDAWVRSLPRDLEVPMLSEDVAQLVRSTSPQHRVELLQHDRARLPGFVYLDGRMMYAALTRELGVGPARFLNAHDGMGHFLGYPYDRARYLVRFTVPADWSHVGLLLCKVEGARGGWWAPNEPGYTGETWCDSSEAFLALTSGWKVDVREGLLFTKPAKGRGPLDTWTDRTLRARDMVSAVDAPELVKDMARGALRSQLLFGIGAFHSTGRDVTRVYQPGAVPTDLHPDQLEPLGDVIVVRERQVLGGRNALMHHPEWSSQVWGRAHTRLLDGPTGDRARRAGALHVPYRDVIGMRGDALYLAADPGWPDDGKVGRLRVKGRLGPVNAPTTATELNKLRARSEGAPGGA